MALPPITSDLATRSVTLAGFNPASEEVRLKTIHEIFDWLRSDASTPEEKLLIDAEEAAFMKTYGDEFALPKDGLTVKNLIAWALYGSSPFDP
jgi:hypothetical protein